ncbi:salicylate carboxymethyltransferase-like [Eucalyptus grandis]|uniref:salicylate carboxymethyltransferase-like n=1 Tax=Eucalyptus grandis TaxID=71139 RepID=UPI00192EE1B1|nr:salicylate carboxymethyltransferase-like [Eucalyptus grandis]
MKEGMGETSYANNSLLQRKVISMTKPITEAAITAFFSTIAATIPASLTIADLGCSCGANSLFAVSEIISIMIDLCNAKKHELPEFQVFLNDLPGNDFNTLFSSFLPRFQEKLSEQMKSKYGASAVLACFFNGVPGSFCGRLFAWESLHFIHSSYSLHWLSQGIIEEEKLDSFNVPYYTPSPKEVRREVEKQGSFSIDCLEVFEVNRDVFETDFDPNVVSKEAADKIVGSLRAIAEPLLVHHFGEEIINEVFERFRAKLGNRFSKEKIPLGS